MSSAADPRQAPTQVGVVIAAGGASRRMEGTDKLQARVLGRPVLAHTVQRFHDSRLVDRIVLVLHPDRVDDWRSAVRRHGWDRVSAVVPGGARRQDSVEAGLRALGPCEWVVVHDGARPCVTHEIIQRGLQAVAETGAAIAAVPATDTIKVIDQAHLVIDTPRRDSLWLVQTPQLFGYDILLRSYEELRGEVTDDASAVEQSGHRVKVFMGSYENLKVTTPADLALVEIFLRAGQ